MPIFNNLPKNSQKLAAWAAAGAVFGLWTWWDQREDGTVLRQDEIMRQNQARIGRDKSLRTPRSNQSSQDDSAGTH